MNARLKGIPIYDKPKPHYIWEDVKLCLGGNIFELLHDRLQADESYPVDGILVEDAERLLNNL